METNTLGAWKEHLDLERFAPLFERAERVYEEGEIYPPREQLFSAFALTQPEQVRVVILGQDPYHEPGQAHGLAFSVQHGVKLPPSLANIYKERRDDLGIEPSADGCLEDWAKQGVFLLNTVLTVEKGKANSHKKLGWQEFTDHVVEQLAKLPQPIAFVLWGNQAQKKAVQALQSAYPRLVLQSSHPSPLSAYRGFFGSRPFSQINAFLQAHGEQPIQW